MPGRDIVKPAKDALSPNCGTDIKRHTRSPDPCDFCPCVGDLVAIVR